MALLPSVIEAIKIAVTELPYGQKRRYLEGVAKDMGISRRSLERYITPEALPEQVKNKRVVEPNNPEYHEWADVVAKIKKRPPEEAGEISTEQAVRIAVENDLIPQEALSVSRATYDRIMREKGYNKVKKPNVRYQAAYANQAHHFDASSSKCFYVARYDGNEPILKLFRPAKHYKNKPTPVGVRPWIYGVVDDFSGKLITQYVIANGESMTDSVRFLATHGWRKLGLPEILLADQGMLKKGLASQDFMARLNIEFPEMNPYSKEAHGKIERPWRTMWQRFELQFFAIDNWKKFEITLAELNSRLEQYLIEYNNMPHRYEREFSREDMWHNSLLLYGGITVLPEDALGAMVRRSKRKIGTDGTLLYEGGEYTVRGCYDEQVYVFEGIFTDKLVVQCIRTGEKFEAEPLQVLSLGDYMAIPQTPHQQIVQESQNISITKTLFTEPEAPDNIVRVPLKETEQPLVSPLDTSVYNSVEQALGEFYKMISGSVSLSNEKMEQLREAIIQKGLKREFVKETAGKLIKNTRMNAV